MSENLWLVTQWLWGGGGDDRTRVVAVCSTSEKAYEIAGQQSVDQYHHECLVEAFPIDQVVPERRT